MIELIVIGTASAILVVIMVSVKNSKTWAQWFMRRGEDTPPVRPASKRMTPSTSSPMAMFRPSPGRAFIVREDWGAREPVGEMEANHPSRISIHHTAMDVNTAKSIGTKMLEIQAYHQNKRGSPDISYHFFIDYQGDIAEGRKLKDMVSPQSYDGSGLVHIVLEGNFTKTLPTEAQIGSLKRLVLFLSDQYPITSNDIYGHKDFYSDTLCPGALYDYIPQIRSLIE